VSPDQLTTRHGLRPFVRSVFDVPGGTAAGRCAHGPDWSTAGYSARRTFDFTTYAVGNLSHDAGVAERAAQAVKLARTASLPVFHVVPESRRADIHPMVAPTADERVLVKTTIGVHDQVGV